MSIIENTALMREVIDKMDYMVRIMDADQKVIYMNHKMQDKFGQTMEHICYSLLGKEEKCELCVTREAKETGRPSTKNVPIGDRYFNVISSPVNVENGQSYSFELLRDITESKKTEDELLKHYEKLKADIKFAKNLQNRALPIDGIYWEAFELNSAYHPSEDLGGDLFDVININDGESLIYIADVSGHGITSSLLTIFIRQMIRSYVGERKADLLEILAHLQKSYDESGADKEQYLTIQFCLYNKEKKEATFLNAGHNCMPIILKETGEVREIEVTGMPVCSLTTDITHKPVTVSVEAGDRIIMYTDGIMEACNGSKGPNEPLEAERVMKTIRENMRLDGKTLAEKVVADAEACSGKPGADDMAIIVVKLI